MITYEAFILIVCVRKKGKADTKLQYIIVCFCSRSIILNISIVLIENHEKGFFFKFYFPISVVYCGINRFRGGSFFLEFFGTSHSRVSILHKFINWGYKVEFSFVRIR